MKSKSVSGIFKDFFDSSDVEEIIASFNAICDHIQIPATITRPLDRFSYFLDRSKRLNHRFDQLLTHLKLKADSHEYKRANLVRDRRALVVGAGPGGLRTAIELILLGCDTVTIIEKRSEFTRNNVLHLWPFSVSDIKSLGGKVLYGKFGIGSLNHIAIRRVQIIFLKIALVLGVEFCSDEFVDVEYHNHLYFRLSQDSKYNPRILFNILVGCDGQNSLVASRFQFERKTLNFGTAIGISANFIKSETISSNGRIGGRISYLNRPFFRKLKESYKIDLENIVYYDDETHYTVMTAKKHCLLHWGVLKQDLPGALLLESSNIDYNCLERFVRQVATEEGIPETCEFADFGGRKDVAIFDFSSSSASKEPSIFYQERDATLFVSLVGDSLILPFWPLGTGLAHACLSALDLGWVVSHMGHPSEWRADQNWILSKHATAFEKLEVSSAESMFQRDCYPLDPDYRYKTHRYSI